MKETSRKCEQCGKPLGRFAPAGICAPCLLETALSGSATAPTAEATMARGTLGIFGNYELMQEVGHGGMGIIYRARDLTLNRVVALKVMLAGQFASEREVKRFKTEAEAAARLDHPNIVPIYEFGELEGRPFLSMRFVDGENLAQRLHGTPMDALPAAQLLSKLARAIHYAHQRGILHRDLKPANVLLDSADQPHLTDFGLAKCLDSNEGLTLSGAMLGSPNYMSPEQAAGNPDRLTTAADIYSLGAMLYELLTGRPPFRAETPLETMRKVVEESPTPPSQIYRFAERELETICLKCMEKEPARRYGSADALAEDLERWLRHEPIQARPVSAIGRLRKWTERNPMSAGLVTLLGLAIAAFLVGQTVMSVRLGRANTKVKVANAELSHSLYEMRWRQVDEALQANETSDAIAQLSYFVRQNPHDRTAAARLLSQLSDRNFPLLIIPPLVHEALVTSLDFNQAGNLLATVTANGRARLWNLESGKVEIELTHPAHLNQCAFCGENDRRLLTLSTEPKLRLWDLDTHQLMSEVELGPLTDAMTWRSLIFTRDHRRLAINVQSNAVAILDTETGVWLKSRLTLPVEIRRVAMSADGSFLALASASEVRLCRFDRDEALFPAVQLTSPPEDIRFSDDGRWVACSCLSKVWVMNTSTGVREPEFIANAFRIAFLGTTDRLITSPANPSAPMSLFDPHIGKNCGSPFGQPQFNAQWHGGLLFSTRDASAYYPRTLWLLDAATGQPQTEPFIHAGPILAAKLRSDGRVVATASQDGTVRIWSAEMRKAEPMTFHAGTVYEAQWSPSGERILTTSMGGTQSQMQVWDARCGKALYTPRPQGAEFAQWALDGSRFATAADAANIWDAETFRPVCPPLQHKGTVVHCAFSPNSKLLATAGVDQLVRLWDGQTGSPLNPPLLHSQVPLKIDFSSDSRRLATGCMDGTIRVWSVPDGKLLLGPLHHSGICWVAAFSPDGRRLVSASSDNTAQLWDADTGQPVLPPFWHEGPVLWASFSPDGRAIVTSTELGTARVWDTATGQLLSGPMNHPGKVWYVKWSPNGHLLATTCTDGCARVWDAQTGHLVTEPFRHEAEVRRAEFSPDGKRLLTASFDGTAKVWDLTLVHPPLPVPQWLPVLAESLGGKRIGPRDSLEAVAGDTFQSTKANLARWGTNDYYGRWAHWLLEGRFETPVKPFRSE
jgi:WD40 repeat protein